MTTKNPWMSLAAALALPLMAQAGPQTPAEPTIPEVSGAKLTPVPGPMTRTAEMADPGLGVGTSISEARYRTQARRGSVPAVAVPAGNIAVAHWVEEPAGWMAYRVEAGPMETVKARLRGVHPAWFQVRVVNKWGQLGAGMLQNRIPTGNPEASFINRGKEPQTVFFVVDTTTSILGKEAFTLTFIREPIDPAKP